MTELPVLPWLPHSLAIIFWVTSRFPWSQYTLVCDITFWISGCQPGLMQNIMSIHHITGSCLEMIINQMQGLQTEVSNHTKVRGSKLHIRLCTAWPVVLQFMCVQDTFGIIILQCIGKKLSNKGTISQYCHFVTEEQREQILQAVKMRTAL